MKKEILLSFDQDSFEEVKAKLMQLYEISEVIGKRVETIRNIKVKIDYWFAFFSFLGGVLVGTFCMWIFLGQL